MLSTLRIDGVPLVSGHKFYTQGQVKKIIGKSYTIKLNAPKSRTAFVFSFGSINTAKKFARRVAKLYGLNNKGVTTDKIYGFMGTPHERSYICSHYNMHYCITDSGYRLNNEVVIVEENGEYDVLFYAYTHHVDRYLDIIDVIEQYGECECLVCKGNLNKINKNRNCGKLLYTQTIREKNRTETICWECIGKIRKEKGFISMDETIIQIIRMRGCK